MLKFDQKVLNICSENYKEQISKVLQLSIPIPSLICLFCQTPIAFDEFLYRNCNSLQVPAVSRIGLVDQGSSFFRYSRILEKSTGTLPKILSRNALTFGRISEFTFVDITDGNTRMLLRRLGDMKLIWLVEREAISLTAKWDLRETPDTNSIVFTFVWSPEQVKIISES